MKKLILISLVIFFTICSKSWASDIIAIKDKSKKIEQDNDNIRIALDALNYTFTGNKKERSIIVLDAGNCIFGIPNIGGNYNKLYLNNVIIDTINFYPDQYYDEWVTQQWVETRKMSFSGDEPVYINSNNFDETISKDTDWERLRKAWGVIYSKACKGADAGEF